MFFDSHQGPDFRRQTLRANQVIERQERSRLRLEETIREGQQSQLVRQEMSRLRR